MRKYFLWSVLLLAIVSAVAGLLIANPQPERTPKLTGDWSRGMKLGLSAWNQPAAMQVEPAGERVHVVWFAPARDSGMVPEYVQLDAKASVLVRRQVIVAPVLLAKESRLLLDPSGKLHLFTRAARSLEETNRVIYFPLNKDGSLRSEPQPLTPAGQEVTGYAVALDPAGQMDLFWAQDPGAVGRQGGLYHLRLDGGGKSITAPLLVTSLGHDPAAQTDEQGTIHLAWLRHPNAAFRELYYAAFQHGAVAATEGSRLAEYSGVGAYFHKPAVGLDTTHVYIFWSVDLRSGPLAGTATSSYVAFPIGQPREQQPVALQIPPSGAPAYALHVGPYSYRQLAYWRPEAWGVSSELMYMPSPVLGQRGELPVLLAELVNFRPSRQVQPVLAVFARGELQGYQVVARSPDLTIYPQAAADRSGNLHAIWLGNVPDGYLVYYTSTLPGVKDQLDRIEPADLGFAAVGALWGVTSGLIFLPFLPLIFVPPLFWLGLYHLLGGALSLDQRGGQFAVFVAVLLYLGAKTLLFLSLFSQVLVAGPMPEAWVQVTTCGVPLVIALAAGGLVSLYYRGRAAVSVFAAFLLFGLADMALTMIIYGAAAFGQR